MELSFYEHYAHLINLIKEGGEDGELAEQRLLRVAGAMDDEVEERENDQPSTSNGSQVTLAQQEFISRLEKSNAKKD